MTSDTNRTVDDVRRFWSNNPLFSGEGTAQPGTAEWFQEHERVYVEDCFAGSGPDPIFLEKIPAEARILDVGCGPGFWVRYFLRQGYKDVSACDLTETAVDLTKTSLGLFGLKADVVVGNAEELPYKPGSFDHVNCQGVIHHTPNTIKCIREFHRVLKPNGTLCFSVYHQNFLLRNPGLLRAFSMVAKNFIGLRGRGRERLLDSADAEEIVRMYDGAANPIGKAFTLTDMKKMIHGYFEIENIGYFFFPARALPIRIPRFLHKWLHVHFGLMLVIRARKIS